MAPVALFVFSVLTNLVVLHSFDVDKHCPPYYCNEKVGNISFPFKFIAHPPECGLFTVDCPDGPEPSGAKIKLREGGHWYEFDTFYPLNKTYILQLTDQRLQRQLDKKDFCSDHGLLNNLSLPIPSPVFETIVTPNMTLFQCPQKVLQNAYRDLKYLCDSNGYHLYYMSSTTSFPSAAPPCSIIQLPIRTNPPQTQCDLSALTATFTLHVQVSDKCYACYDRGGKCETLVEGGFNCTFTKKGDETLKLKLGLGIGIGGPALLVGCLYILWRYKQKRLFLSRNISSQPYSHSDVEGGSADYGVPVFTYNELKEATNHFNSEKELGDGGFGTVYHGKLKDGREVAVKRLYEHNCKRVEQFINEIEILTHLRHKNLVSLYGCTSRRSRELLLVYEYVPNGTVADHLHGDRADPGSLTWPIRMSIAIETASALSYLHASEIVHRDVKTTNILLDNNFCVKVADFGLSRIFPIDVTHVSTAPQGTPGYVDPEYHQCYQLTSKSDVYSFGVVLIELISSMPAVDISRHRDEISLANLAMKKIQKGIFNELVDPCIGFESDNEVRRMTIAVAELAFQCLQQDNDMRPTMNEVLEALKIIESGDDVPENLKRAMSIQPPPSPDCDEVGLLKHPRPPSSPNSVTQQWPSTRSTTPNASG